MAGADEVRSDDMQARQSPGGPQFVWTAAALAIAAMLLLCAALILIAAVRG